MILTKNKTLKECCPEVVVFSDFLIECEMAVNQADLQSDEFSTEDEELANEERKNNQRNSRILNTNSVIKVKEKLWRSNKVSIKLNIL